MVMRQDQRLAELDHNIADGHRLFRTKDRRIWVADQNLAREVLRNSNGNYVPHSDFFGRSAGSMLPRESQIKMAIDAREVLEGVISRLNLHEILGAIPVQSIWPRTGSTTIHAMTEELLAGSHRSEAFKNALGQVLEAKIFSRVPESPLSVSRLRRRYSYALAFAKERRSLQSSSPADLLDVVFRHGTDANDEQLLDIYSSFVFAIVSSLGLVFSWSVLLSAQHNTWETNPRHVVAESLRLYPIAWFLERHVAREHVLDGLHLQKGAALAVSPYAIQRNPSAWERADVFEPSRWESATRRDAWLPFGAGQHMCVAAEFTMSTIAALLSALTNCFDVQAQVLDRRQKLSSSLVPPTFMLSLARR